MGYKKGVKGTLKGLEGLRGGTEGQLNLTPPSWKYSTRRSSRGGEDDEFKFLFSRAFSRTQELNAVSGP